MTSSESAPDSSDSEVARLQTQIARLTRRQQELVHTQDRLDREIERSQAIHDFNRRAVPLVATASLGDLVVESLCEIFESEFAGFWVLSDSEETSSDQVFTVGLDDSDTDALRSLVTKSLSGESIGTVLVDGTTSETLGASGFRQVAAVPCLVQGQVCGLLACGVLAGEDSFYEDLSEEDMASFRLFGQQVGALLQERRNQARIEEQLAELLIEEQRLQVALAGSRSGLWDWEIDEDRVFFSDQWKAQIGYGPTEIENTFQEWLDRIHPDDLDRVMGLVKTYLEGRDEDYEAVHRLRHKDGHYVWIMARGSALRDGAGHAYRMVGVHVDITDQRKAQEAAEAANRAKNAFLAVTSHELRTPLNGIVGALQVLKEDERGLSREQADMIELAIRSSDLLGTLISDASDISRIEAGELALEERPFDVRRELAAAMELHRRQADEKGLHLQIQTQPNVPQRLVGDPVRLNQLLSNLVTNAIKFTDRGSVRVDVEGASSGEDRFHLHVRVADTGIGMTEEQVSHVFQTFTQASTEAARVHGGTGLGLAISGQLAELMGGQVKVESSLGVGSTFELRLTLPVAPVDGRGQTRDSARTVRPQLVGHVAVVDDNEVNLRLASKMLSLLGLSVESYQTGQAFLDDFRPGHFGAVLMDLQMPELDGFEVTRRLRVKEQAQDWPRTPVIALTATVTQEDRDHSEQAGMDGFLSKPFKKATLLEVLAEHLPC